MLESATKIRSNPVYLIHDGAFDEVPLEKMEPADRPVLLDWARREQALGGARVLVFLSDDRVRELLPMALERQWEVAVLPHPNAPGTSRLTAAKGRIEDLIDHYRSAEATESDVLTCNDEPVLSCVSIGENLTIEPNEQHRPPSQLGVFLRAIKRLKTLALSPYSLTTAKQRKVGLAALGMIVMAQPERTLFGRRLTEHLRTSDGRVSLMILAPRSILGYCWFLIRMLLPWPIAPSRLPPSVGVVASTSILLASGRGIEYALDGIPVAAKQIELRIAEQRIRLLPGPSMAIEASAVQNKDTVRIANLPVDESARQLVGRPLPLISHASEDDYRDLFVTLRDNAIISSPYLVLMVLSVLLALTGLYADSAPVIIGAMILAPLMAPIVSLSMGLARVMPPLIRGALRTLMVGIGTGLFFAVLVAWLMPLQNLTTEMQARLSPTLLDLSVAVISGIAGAYAHAREEVTKSLAGVAIAVALVPPLSVVGIGIGWGDWPMAQGALLLFATNLVGICLAASATFLVMGFAPFKLATRGLAVTLAVLALIVSPLYLAFMDLVEQGRIVHSVPTGHFELQGQALELRLVEVRTGAPPLVRVQVSAPHHLDSTDIDALKRLIAGRIGGDLTLEAQISLRR